VTDLLEFGGWRLADLLSDALRTRLRDSATVVAYNDGVLIHARGEVKPGLSIVQAGAVRFANPGADGAYATTSILGPGQCFGEATLFAGLPRAYDAVAVGDTVIEQIPKPTFDRIFDEEPELARAMLQSTTRRLYGVLDFLEDLRSLPLHVRVAKLLASMASSSKNKDVVECNQTDLAFTMGVTRVSVGSALGKLQSAELIQLGYGKITILDQQNLNSWIADQSNFAPLHPASELQSKNR